MVSNLKDILKHIWNDNNFLKFNSTKIKRELGLICREPQIIFQRAACGSRTTVWPPWLYNKKYIKKLGLKIKLKVKMSF